MALRPDHANEPLILATGAVVIWWGRIEGMLFQELLSLRGDPAVQQSGDCEILQIATDRLIDQWAKASRRVAKNFPDVQTEISAIKVELKDCAETRHVIVHGFWAYPSPDQDPASCIVTVAKPQRDGQVSIAQYEITYATATEFHDRLAHLYHRLLALTLNAAFSRLGKRPKAELTEIEASPASRSSRNPAPSRKLGVSLHRDTE